MKKSKFTEEQIAFALHQAETGTSVEEVCRKIGISQATFYAWKKKYGGMGVSELRRLRQLEEENRMRFSGQEFYLKSRQEMERQVAARCSVCHRVQESEDHLSEDGECPHCFIARRAA